MFILKEITLLHRKAELAIYIGNETYKGKGLSKVIMREGLSFGFNKLGLNRIDLKVIENNDAAIALYQSLGFVKEGILRQAIFKNGEFKNEIIMSLLNKEFNV